MTTLSKEAQNFETDDYALRVVEIDGKNVYGIFNKVTGVQEGRSEQLWFAVLAAISLQISLKRALDDYKSGALTDTSAAPQISGFGGPPQFN